MQSPTPGDGPAPGNRSVPAPQSPTSTIWQEALKSYYDELAKGGMSSATIDKDVWSVHSLGELLAQIEGLGNGGDSHSSSWAKTLSQLQPVILGLNDFAALAAWVLGMNGKMAVVLWGSIRLFVKVDRASPLVQLWLTGLSSMPNLSFPMLSALLRIYSRPYPGYANTRRNFL